MDIHIYIHIRLKHLNTKATVKHPQKYNKLQIIIIRQVADITNLLQEFTFKEESSQEAFMRF